MSSKIDPDRIDWSLYAIIDHEWLRGRDVADTARKAIRGGAGVLQYRNKVSPASSFFREALAARRVAADHGIPFIVNDRMDIAMTVDADGIHLGQDDLPSGIVWDRVGDRMIVGGSVHSAEELDQMRVVDYLGVGTVYPTGTKRRSVVRGVGIIRQIRQLCGKPIVGIGGITVDNLGAVFEAGADGIAVISGLLGPDDVESAARAYRKAIAKARKEEV